MERILAVDTNVSVHEEKTKKWTKYGIGTQRVNTMNDAIDKLVQGDEFLFVVINEDTISDFMKQLPIMRDATELPLFVVTSAYTLDKKIKAMSLGADVYEPFIAYAEQNVLLALEILKAQNRWAKRPQKQLSILTGGDIILSRLRRKVFVKDTEVSLAKKEFDILRYLMANSGCVVEHKELIEEIWGKGYNEKDTDILWRTVNRIRTKLSNIYPDKEYIRIERGVGYVFEP
ncbi:MAG: winged helix-turn-helix domain-containing protein [Peptococcaceae bacterium]|jgi:two-component system response regulator VicR|nr:winged helix-turn-helix domain-containing protein [Peptococcaceae bacterium]